MLSASTTAALITQNSEANTQPVNALAYLKSVNKGRQMTDAQAGAVAKDFEAMFLSQMMGSMFGDSTGESFFGSGETKEIYKSLLMNEYGKSMATVGGIGIASHVKGELLKMQEIKV